MSTLNKLNKAVAFLIEVALYVVLFSLFIAASWPLFFVIYVTLVAIGIMIKTIIYFFIT